MSFFSRKKKKKSFVVFDIGSASVGAALVEFLPGELPRMRRQSRETIVFQKKFEYEHFERSMLKALETVAMEMTRHSSSVDALFCVLSSPWFMSQTNVVTRKGDQFEITEEILDEIVASEMNRVSEKQGRDNVDVIEKNILKIDINGYSATNVIGKNAVEMKTFVHLSVVPKNIIFSMRTVLERHFNNTRCMFRSFPLVATSVVRDIFPEDNDFIFIDVTGEVTDVSLVKSDSLQETISFPKGKNFLLRQVSKDTKTIPEEIISQILLSEKGEISDDALAQMERCLSLAEIKWLPDFQKILSIFNERGMIPHKIFLTTDQDVSGVFKRFIESDRFGQGTFTQYDFDISVINSSILIPFCDNSERIGKVDPFLCIETIFLNKLLLIESSI